ncbi:contactin-4-like isoform X3 [Xenia sp. Carnegie-2017]|uniref:contactin-4-like isoform X3 n=1 Tax=Xenia sp. Carnegie-2017 TaxID=2897299 RepID=UPI001F0341E0|nr:contactin-4-like isoform X3 [Xenia sp. Carnegie-2017]
MALLLKHNWIELLKLRYLTNFVSLLLLLTHFERGRSQLKIEDESVDYDGGQDGLSKLRCKVVGLGKKTYEWYHNRTKIDGIRYKLPGFLSFDSDTLTFHKINNRKYEGNYQLFVTSDFGRIFCRKMKVKFKVAGEFASGPLAADIRDVTVGKPFQINCPKHSYMRGCVYNWGKSNAFGMKHLKRYQNRVILSNGTLLFSAITQRDVDDFSKDDYQCIVDCWFGNFHSMSRSHSVYLNKRAVNVSKFGPKIVTRIPHREVLLGTDYVHVTCAAEGSPPPSYRWVKYGKADERFDVRNTRDMKLGKFNHTLTISNINKKHNGTYGCVATIEGRSVMQTWRLLVREKPSWLPDGKIMDMEVNVFSNFFWDCKARGNPVPEYIWFSNASEMVSSSGKFVIDQGKLEFTRVLLSDMGMYQCVARNKFGEIYQTVALIVRARKPEFNESFVDALFLVNSSATLKCRSNAIPRAVHTWTKSGTSIRLSRKYQMKSNGELLIINSIQELDAAVYKCTAENVFGEAELKINVSVESFNFVKRPESNFNMKKGRSFSLFCEVNTSRQIRYKWTFNSGNLKYDAGHVWLKSMNRLLIQNSKESDSGRYECVAYIEKPNVIKRSAFADIAVVGPPDPLDGFRLKGGCNNNTALLTWHNHSLYKDYEVFVKLQWQRTECMNGWHTVAKEVSARDGRVIVEGLPNWSKIQFKAYARNKHGFSPASNLPNSDSCVTSPSRPVKCPENIVFQEGSPGVLLLKWKTMNVSDYNGPGFNFIVKYKRPQDSSWSTKVLEKTADQITILSKQVKQLWNFSLQTNNSEGLGPVCLENSSFSGQSVPGRISQITVKEIATSSVLLIWPPPLSDHWNIDGYISTVSWVK